MCASLHVSLHRYRPGDAPKHQRRLCEGQSNAATALRQERDAVERAFVTRQQPRSRLAAGACAHGAALTTSEQHVRAGYCSTYAASCAAHRQRGSHEATTATADDGGDRSCVYTAAQMRTMLRVLAPDLLATTTHTAAAAAASTRRWRSVMRPPTPAQQQQQQQQQHEPHARRHDATTWRQVVTHTHPVVASLLYNNAHGKGHAVHRDGFFFAAAHGGADACVRPQCGGPSAAGGQLEYDDAMVHDRWCRNQTVTQHYMRHRTQRDDNEDDNNDDKSSSRPRDAWVRQFVPSVQPYQVERCLGRCGRTDYRLTFDDVQPSPPSDMYASAAERFRTVQRVPLATPNDWQVRGRRCVRDVRVPNACTM